MAINYEAKALEFLTTLRPLREPAEVRGDRPAPSGLEVLGLARLLSGLVAEVLIGFAKLSQREADFVQMQKKADTFQRTADRYANSSAELRTSLAEAQAKIATLTKALIVAEEFISEEYETRQASMLDAGGNATVPEDASHVTHARAVLEIVSRAARLLQDKDKA